MPGQLINHPEKKKNENGPLPHTTHLKTKWILDGLFKYENFKYNTGKHLYNLGVGKDFLNKTQSINNEV